MFLITKPALKTKDDVDDITDAGEKWILGRIRGKECEQKKNENLTGCKSRMLK